MSDPSRSGSHDDAATQRGVLDLANEKDFDVAVIESTLIVEEVDQQRRRLVRKALSVKHHYGKTRCRLPSLTEPLISYKAARRLSIRNLFAQLKSQKSNSEKIEWYMRRCALDPIISKSSLFRDFLSVQREEDSAAEKEVLQQFVNMQATLSTEQQQSPVLDSVTSEDAQVPDVTPVPVSGSRRIARGSRVADDALYRKVSSSLSTLSENPGISLADLAKRQKRLSAQQQIRKEATSIQDFQLIKVLGKGCMGKVILVRERRNGKLLALKAIKRDILATIAEISHPFLIKLHHSFQDADQLFLVLEFYVGGDMATQLAKHYRFDAERCRLYIAEILLGLQELHRIGVLYRDLKPENILIAADGHIVLTDFGLSKQFAPSFIGDSQRTNTFCGTAEYLAPEILRAEPYSFEVDFWSLGTLLYEFLTGITPFWAETHTDMYRRVLEDELAFPEGFDPITADFIDGLLQRDPSRRLGVGPNGPQEICSHPYFDGLDWEDVFHKRITPTYVPDLKSDMDFSNFDDTFLQMVPRISSPPGKIILTSEIQDIFDGYSYTESVVDSDDIIYSTDVSDELYVDQHNDSQQFSPETEDGYPFDTDSAISGKHTSRVIGSDMADVMPTIDSSDDELNGFDSSAHYLAKKRLNESASYQHSSLPRSQTMAQSDGSNSSFGGYSDQERKRFSKRRNTVDIEPTAEGNIAQHGFSLPTLPSTQATSMFSSVHKIDKTENLVCTADRQVLANDYALSDDESMAPSPQSTSDQVPDQASMTIPDFESEKTLDLELPIYKLIDINTKPNDSRRHSTPSSFNFRFPDFSATFPVFKRKSKRYQRAI
ncbi:hypothetical protein NQZ79_g780 [Umbelopsis isabellina]|nr:hypothetical protein NQZ79_g780 [Umbelopsis isabellina]